MDTKLIEFIFNQTGAIGLAALMLHFLNQAQAESRKRVEDYARNLEATNERLFKLAGENTRAITELQSEVRELRQDLGDCDDGPR